MVARLLCAIYFGAGLHRWRPPWWPSRQPPARWGERLHVERYGPSRLMVCGVALLWLVALLLVGRAITVVLRGT